MPKDAIAIIIGVVCGVLASIPVSLLIMGIAPNRVSLISADEEAAEGESA